MSKKLAIAVSSVLFNNVKDSWTSIKNISELSGYPVKEVAVILDSLVKEKLLEFMIDGYNLYYRLPKESFCVNILSFYFIINKDIQIVLTPNGWKPI